MPIDLKKVIPCSSCDQKFSEQDVKLGNYYPSILTCKACCEQMKKSLVTCFGKMYDVSTPECSKECPDRKVCRVFARVHA